jgi:hypothetical protein
LRWGRNVIREENTEFCNFLVGRIFVENVDSKNNEKGGLY